MTVQELITSPAFVAALFSILSVALVKVFEFFVLGKNLKVNEIEKYTTDLKEDLDRLEKHVTEAYAKMGEWRERYYKEVEASLALKVENSDLRRDLKNLKLENESIKKENKKLRDDVDRMKEDLQLVKNTALSLESRVDDNAIKDVRV